MRDELKAQRALANLSELLGTTIQAPLEDQEALMWQAQSVLNYFKSRGQGFKERPCKWCGCVFAYAYSFEGVGYCSIQCASRALQEIGIQWQPGKPLSERWGQYVPAVVPSQVLEILEARDPEPLASGIDEILDELG